MAKESPRCSVKNPNPNLARDLNYPENLYSYNEYRKPISSHSTHGQPKSANDQLKPLPDHPPERHDNKYLPSTPVNQIIINPYCDSAAATSHTLSAGNASLNLSPVLGVVPEILVLPHSAEAHPTQSEPSPRWCHRCQNLRPFYQFNLSSGLPSYACKHCLNAQRGPNPMSGPMPGEHPMPMDPRVLFGAPESFGHSPPPPDTKSSPDLRQTRYPIGDEYDYAIPRDSAGAQQASRDAVHGVEDYHMRGAKRDDGTCRGERKLTLSMDEVARIHGALTCIGDILRGGGYDVVEPE